MKPFLSRHISPRTAIGFGVLVLIVSFLGGREKSDTHAYAAPAVQRAAPPMQPADALDPGKLQRHAKDDAIGNLFAASVVPPQPQNDVTAVQATAPVAPAAPPLPFRYLGKAVEDGSITVFVARGEEHYSAKAGAKIGRDYRVDRVTEKAVAFTYLPMRARQSLPLPSSDPIAVE